MAGSEIETTKAPEVTLLKSEMEAAAARVAERAMNYTVDGVTGLLSDVFGGWIGDPIKQWRTRRLIDALAKTKDHLQAKGIPLDRAKTLPMGELYMMFEGASKQDDPQLTDMWAALLSNAMNPDSDISLDPSLIRLLENLSGLDAAILDYLSVYEREKDVANVHLKAVVIPKRNLSEPETPEVTSAMSQIKAIETAFHKLHTTIQEKVTSRFDVNKISLSLSNLLRLGLILDQLEIDYHRPLLAVTAGRYDDYKVHDGDLKNLLNAMIQAINIRAEETKKGHTLTFNSGHKNLPDAPSFRLSGLGKRLLAVCT